MIESKVQDRETQTGYDERNLTTHWTGAEIDGISFVNSDTWLNVSRPVNSGVRHHDKLDVSMKKTNQCPKCKSRRILTEARVIDKASKGGPALNLELAVNKDPDALLFKGEERFTIRAWVCADCGYTELYTDDAGAAYNVTRGDA